MIKLNKKIKYVSFKLRKQNRQKGRVSVPASFRSYLNSQGYNGFVTYPSFNHQALESCAMSRIEKLSDTIDDLNPFEDRRDFFATSVLSESVNLQFDTEGRVQIPTKLIEHAKIKILHYLSD